MRFFAGYRFKVVVSRLPDVKKRQGSFFDNTNLFNLLNKNKEDIKNDKQKIAQNYSKAYNNYLNKLRDAVSDYKRNSKTADSYSALTEEWLGDRLSLNCTFLNDDGTYSHEL